MAEQRGAIVGHHAAWGLFRTATNVRPFKLTPGATDTMPVRVREKIDIFGVGTDVVQMEGIFVVRRSDPKPADSDTKQRAWATGDDDPPSVLRWADAAIDAEFRALELHGESPVFGTVRVGLSTRHTTRARVLPDPRSEAKGCEAQVYPRVELPELGMTLETGDSAVPLASKVVQVPPVGDVARSEGGAPLVDESGNEVGEIVSTDIEVGEVLYSVPLGSTGRRAARAD